jgi:hypothetical protein
LFAYLFVALDAFRTKNVKETNGGMGRDNTQTEREKKKKAPIGKQKNQDGRKERKRAIHGLANLTHGENGSHYPFPSHGAHIKCMQGMI